MVGLKAEVVYELSEGGAFTRGSKIEYQRKMDGTDLLVTGCPFTSLIQRSC